MLRSKVSCVHHAPHKHIFCNYSSLKSVPMMGRSSQLWDNLMIQEAPAESFDHSLVNEFFYVLQREHQFFFGGVLCDQSVILFLELEPFCFSFQFLQRVFDLFTVQSTSPRRTCPFHTKSLNTQERMEQMERMEIGGTYGTNGTYGNRWNVWK